MKKSPALPPSLDLDTSAKRLKYVIEQSGIKQSHIAKKLGVTRGAVHYILNSGVKNSKSAKKIAAVLGVDPEWLETGISTAPPGTVIKTNQGGVPVYYIDQLLIHKHDQNNGLTPISQVFAQRHYNEPLFAIHLSQACPLQKFESGDIIILSKRFICDAGDWVLVYEEKQARIVFGLVILQDENMRVVLHHKTEPPLKLNVKSDPLMGVFVESIKYAKM